MGYLYVQNLMYKLEISEQNQQKLQIAIEERDLIIEKMKIDFDKMRKINEELNDKFSIAEKDIINLQKRFNSSKDKPRDFNKIAQKNAKELQERINIGTKFALRCNEISTGSPIRPEDDNNNICQELINSKKVHDK
jgi:hypothetical protein